MFQKSLVPLMVDAVKKPLFNIKGAHRHIPGSLFFADRAVKSTSNDPRFLCVGCSLACQTSEGAAAIALKPNANAGAPAAAANATGSTGLAAAPKRSAVACVRVEGNSAACIFRNGALVLQCVGDEVPQRHEFSLRQNDIFAIVSGVTTAKQVTRAFADVQELLQGEKEQQQRRAVTEDLLQSPNVSSLAGRDVGGRAARTDVDLEYMAEELLLALQGTAKEASQQQQQQQQAPDGCHKDAAAKSDEGSTAVVGRVLLDASKFGTLPAFCSDALRRA